MEAFVIAELIKRLPKLPAGTVVAINLETGEYVTAPTEAAAFDGFEKKFGWGVPAAVHVVHH